MAIMNKDTDRGLEWAREGERRVQVPKSHRAFSSGMKYLRPFNSPKVSTRFQRVCGHPNLLSIVGMEVSFKVQNCSIPFVETTVSIDRYSNMSIGFL